MPGRVLVPGFAIPPAIAFGWLRVRVRLLPRSIARWRNGARRQRNILIHRGAGNRLDPGDRGCNGCRIHIGRHRAGLAIVPAARMGADLRYRWILLVARHALCAK